MDIFTTTMVAALAFCIGNLVGLGIMGKINRDYVLSMNDTFKDYFLNMLKLEEKYFTDSLTSLAKAVDDLNKNNEIPIWRDAYKELPECDGFYYGKVDDTNSMWKVVYRNKEWYLSGYPEHIMKVIKWTEIY